MMALTAKGSDDDGDTGGPRLVNRPGGYVHKPAPRKKLAGPRQEWQQWTQR